MLTKRQQEPCGIITWIMVGGPRKTEVTNIPCGLCRQSFYPTAKLWVRAFAGFKPFLHFPSGLVESLQITGLKVFFAAKNVFTITNWVGGDPEIKQTLGGSYGYPLAAMYSFGVNLTF